jgi:hypothetical protein
MSLFKPIILFVARQKGEGGSGKLEVGSWKFEVVSSFFLNTKHQTPNIKTSKHQK